MKTRTLLVAMVLASALMVLDAVANTGRPEAFTRGIGIKPTTAMENLAVKRMTVQIGRPEALTRGLGLNVAAPKVESAQILTAQRKAGKPEYHTRGIYCPHLGRRG